MRIANILTTTSIKQRFDRISSDPSSLSVLIGLLLAGIAVGAIVGLDPYLATFMDEHYWSPMLLYEIPFKVSLITVVLFCAVGVIIAWAARAREFREIQEDADCGGIRQCMHRHPTGYCLYLYSNTFGNRG